MKKTIRTFCTAATAALLVATMPMAVFAQNNRGGGLRMRDGSCVEVSERVALRANGRTQLNEEILTWGNLRHDFGRSGERNFNRPDGGFRLRDGSCAEFFERAALRNNGRTQLNEGIRTWGNLRHDFGRSGERRFNRHGVCDGTGISNGGRGINCR